MNKEEILYKLSKLELDKKEYIIISGAALVLQDLIDYTNDIDLSCSKEYFDSINWDTRVGYFNTNIKYYDCFEIGPNFYDINNIINIDGYNVQNLYSLYKLKKIENKEKDKETIKKLERVLNIKSF